MKICPAISVIWLFCAPWDIRAAESLISNGGFENGLAGWSDFWTRTAESGQAVLDPEAHHQGQNSLRIEHRGERDWCVNASQRLPVRAGDIYELSGWAKVQGDGKVVLGVTLYGANQAVIDWSYGADSTGRSQDWRPLKSRFVIPPGSTAILPRWLGSQPVVAWLDEVALHRVGNISELRQQNLPAELTLSNQFLRVTFATIDATVSVLDYRTGQVWRQQKTNPDFLVKKARVEDGLRISLFHLASGRDFDAEIRLVSQTPELTWEIKGEGALPKPLPWPYPFVSDPGACLVVPMNEGISYPVEDPSIPSMRLVAYGGHGICMAFWGVTDGKRGHMAILETPDDAAIRIDRYQGVLYVAPEFDSQKGQFGYARKLRYAFFDEGGHVAIAKRYRHYAQEKGRLKTLAEKRAENPSVDLLIGAVNVWCWDRDAVSIVKEMQAAGIERILWSHRRSSEELKALNDLGVLTSRYDIYQDAMNPANFPYLRGQHADWTSEGWPHDMMIGANGDWIRGWRVKGQDGNWYPCGVLCDKLAPAYAAKRIPAELQTHPYRCRFIDTTTASPWRECYSTAHPMTRAESREWKMRLLEYVSKEAKLVTGCETGHDAAVPYLHYFEGMLSLGPYRVPDAGRDMRKIWEEVPERVAQFQLGHRYRLPLWELVYHDCVVAQWYWGDYNNKLPALWDKRDLFNALYGTPPMFMFDRALWARNQDRFAQSYRATGPIARATGYYEMIDHRFLTANRDVQQTTFANGVTVIVNFGKQPYQLPKGGELGPNQSRIAGLDD